MDEKPKKSKSKNRCYLDGCKKKLGLIPFDCPCEGKFCILHRQPETHQCTFNHYSEKRAILERTLMKQKTVPVKIPII